MIESVKLVRFSDKYCSLDKIPVYIKNKNDYWVAFLFLFGACFGVVVFCYANLNRTSAEFETAVSFIVVCCFIAVFLFLFAIKGGDFVLAADEKGIYYRIFGWKDDFILIEWHIINEITSSYFDGACRIDVFTMIVNHKMPMACNAEISKSRTKKSINISFIIPSSIKGSDIKTRLDELRIKSRNAMLA